MDDLTRIRHEEAGARITALESDLRLMKDRHARYQKIQSLENANEDLITLLKDINDAIPFPLPEWFTPAMQKRVSEVLKVKK